MKSGRKISNAGGKKIIGQFASEKCHRPIVWESQLERDYIYHLEFDSNVIEFKSQPFTVKWVDELDKKRSYTPDFHVMRHNSEEVIEVKPQKKLVQERCQLIMAAMPSFFREKGIEFRVVTDHEIRVEPRLSNIKLLARYRQINITPMLLEECIAYFRKVGSVPIKKAAEDLKVKKISLDILYALLWKGYLNTDMMQPISTSRQVRLADSYKGGF